MEKIKKIYTENCRDNGLLMIFIDDELSSLFKTIDKSVLIFILEYSASLGFKAHNRY